jgi:hypothetical protein
MHFGMKRDASRPLPSTHQENGAEGSISFIARAAVAPQMPSSIYIKHYINSIGIGVDYTS